MCHFFLSLSLSLEKLSVLLLLPSADDISKSMLLQKCLNIFTSAVKLQVYIFMSLMLLITIYCCSVHVFFLHSALLWQGRVIQESATITGLCTRVKPAKWIKLITDKWSELSWRMLFGSVISSVMNRNSRTVFPQSWDAIVAKWCPCNFHSVLLNPQNPLCVYEGRSNNGKSTVKFLFQL